MSSEYPSSWLPTVIHGQLTLVRGCYGKYRCPNLAWALTLTCPSLPETAYSHEKALNWCAWRDCRKHCPAQSKTYTHYSPGIQAALLSNPQEQQPNHLLLCPHVTL
jgi:hypothetical protein